MVKTEQRKAQEALGCIFILYSLVVGLYFGFCLVGAMQPGPMAFRIFMSLNLAFVIINWGLVVVGWRKIERGQ